MSASSPKIQPPRSTVDFVSRSFNRDFIASFVGRMTTSVMPGQRVLEAGAGNRPYAGLFAHASYTSIDPAATTPIAGDIANVIAPPEALPFAGGEFDAILATQVLEHVPGPVAVLRELRRVLSRDGTLWRTAPLVLRVHEEPYDYCRYTPHGLRLLLGRFDRARLLSLSHAVIARPDHTSPDR